MKKVIATMLAFCMLGVLLIACTPKVEAPESGQGVSNEENTEDNNTANSERITVKVAAPGGPTTVSLVKMFKENPSLGENVEVTYESVKSPDLMAAKILSGEVDFTVIPTNLAATLYNKGVKYKLGASTVWGVLYIAGTDTITSWQDLKGKEIATLGRGLTPDILFKYLLKENGLDPEKDIKLNYLSGPQELAQSVLTGKTSIAVLPEPVLSTVTMKKEYIKIILDLQEEWELATGNTSYPQSSLFIKDEIIQRYPEVVDAFLKEYKNSIEWINENPKEAGEWVEELNIGLDSKTAEKSIPGSNLKFVPASEGKNSIEEFLRVLMDFSPESIGGKLPDEGLYLQK